MARSANPAGMSGSPGLPMIRFWSAAVINGTSCPFCVVASGWQTISVSTMANSAFSPGARPNGFETDAPWITGMGRGGGAAWVATGAAATVDVCVVAGGAAADAGVSDGFVAVAACEVVAGLASDSKGGAAACVEPGPFESFEAWVAGDVVFTVRSLDEAGADCAVGFVTAAVAGSVLAMPPSPTAPWL